MVVEALVLRQLNTHMTTAIPFTHTCRDAQCRLFVGRGVVSDPRPRPRTVAAKRAAVVALHEFTPADRRAVHGLALRMVVRSGNTTCRDLPGRPGSVMRAMSPMSPPHPGHAAGTFFAQPRYSAGPELTTDDALFMCHVRSSPPSGGMAGCGSRPRAWTATPTTPRSPTPRTTPRSLRTRRR